MNDGYQYVTPYGKIQTLTPTGHYLLVRRCQAPVSKFLVGEKKYDVNIPFKREGAGDDETLAMAVSDSLAQNIENPICQVLAVGPDVGKWRSSEELSKLRLVTHDFRDEEVPMDIMFTGKVGDFVALPEHASSGRMIRGVTGYEFDLMVDEGELQGAYIPREKVA